MLRFRMIIFAVAFGACLGALATASSGQEPSGLFPEIEPFDSGHLRVSDLHEIYWERCGNPEGKPVMVLHGGPGVGSHPRQRKYFNPEKFHVVLHDQRGTGRSRPVGETRENTTRDLVADIERLRQDLGLGKVVLFGGAWGSTLALAYAETYPEQVTEMVLWAILAGTGEEIDHQYLGARRFFPRVHAELLATLPDPDRRPLPAYLLEWIRTSKPARMDKTLYALARYQLRISSIGLRDDMVDQILARYYPVEAMLPVSTINLHYASNRYFLEEGQLYRDAGKIAPIPVTLINGRFDVVCPPLAAYRLHRLLPKSQLVIVEEAGHSERERGITAALTAAVAELE